MCRDRGDADLLGAFVSACFAAPFPVAGQQIETSASAGLAIAEPGQDATDLLLKADIALYVAKDRGRACCVVFEPEMGRRSEEHTSELQSLMRISYAVFCLQKKKRHKTQHDNEIQQKHKQ